MDRQDLFRNLVIMAVCDGSLAKAEIDLLAERAQQWGVTDADFAKMLEYGLSPNCELTLPLHHDARVELLRELLLMMAADGRLAPAEKRVFAAAASVMNFSDAQINQIIDQTLEQWGGD